MRKGDYVQLIVDVIFPKREHRHQIRSLPDRDLDEPHPLLEGQICRVRMGSEGFGSAADHDDDGFARAFPEDVGAGTFGDRGNAEEEENVAIKGDPEVWEREIV
jgi:hypothetical protein